MQEIDLSTWELMSKRLASQNYISPDKKSFIKFYEFFNEGEKETLEEEHRVSSEAIKLGIPTPSTGGIVKIKGGGYGVLYENIQNKKSLSRAISEDPDNIELYITKFVNIGNVIHSIECDTTKFPSIVNLFEKTLKKHNDVFTSDEMSRVFNHINSIPQKNTCLHGDFHLGNIITNGERDYAIDLSTFSYGNPIFDWGHWYFMSHLMPDFEYLFHLTAEQMGKCWDICEKQIKGLDIYNIDEFLNISAYYPVLFIDAMPFIKDITISMKPMFKLFQ